MDGADFPSTFDAGRILVVDDDQQVRQLLRVAFSASGFDVVGVATGEQALQSLAQGGFDLVVLDVRMPGMSGIEVLRQVRSSTTTQATPVILLTGEDDVASRVQGLNLGASDYVGKPFDVDELVGRVHSQVQSRHASRRELGERLRERAKAVRALAAATSRPLVEDRASAIVDNLVALPPIDGAVIVWLTPEGSAVPLALAGEGLKMSIDRPLSSVDANYLSTRAAVGPWLSPR